MLKLIKKTLDLYIKNNKENITTEKLEIVLNYLDKYGTDINHLSSYCKENGLSLNEFFIIYDNLSEIESKLKETLIINEINETLDNDNNISTLDNHKLLVEGDEYLDEYLKDGIDFPNFNVIPFSGGFRVNILKYFDIYNPETIKTSISFSLATRYNPETVKLIMQSGLYEIFKKDFLNFYTVDNHKLLQTIFNENDIVQLYIKNVIDELFNNIPNFDFIFSLSLKAVNYMDEKTKNEFLNKFLKDFDYDLKKFERSIFKNTIIPDKAVDFIRKMVEEFGKSLIPHLIITNKGEVRFALQVIREDLENIPSLLELSIPLPGYNVANVYKIGEGDSSFFKAYISTDLIT